MFKGYRCTTLKSLLCFLALSLYTSHVLLFLFPTFCSFFQFCVCFLFLVSSLLYIFESSSPRVAATLWDFFPQRIPNIAPSITTFITIWWWHGVMLASSNRNSPFLVILLVMRTRLQFPRNLILTMNLCPNS